MKNKSIISVFAFLLGMGAVSSSCEDMLTPDMERYAEGFSGKDTVNFYLGILANVQDVIENNAILGEVRGDLVTTTNYVSDSLSKVANFVATPDAENGLLGRAAYYKVINQCNFYLAAVDTMAMKNNNYYMRREFAQVQMIRAWTYMQMVQLYGSVPFITEPVDNANTGWETNPPKGFANADNLLDLLLADGLERAYQYEKSLGYPNYGTFNTGAVSIAHSKTVFPGDLVLGDLYLLRGKSKEDYARAAAYYYTYLDKKDLLVNGAYSASYSMRMEGDNEIYTPQGGSWAYNVIGYSDITLVPSAANSSSGKTLTRVQQIYGFDPRSSNSTSVSEDEAVVSGNVALTVNYKNRQLGPSDSYIKLCQSQIAVASARNEVDPVEYLEYLGDCRIDGSFKYVQTVGGRLPFVQKFCSRSSSDEHSLSAFLFRYAIPVYRTNQIYLRYAEAINRAGFPRHAFAVLRNGLHYEKMPSIRYDSVRIDTINQIVYENIPYVGAVADGNYCIDLNELARAKKVNKEQVYGIGYLDFSESKWTNAGIHRLGCGEFTDKDTLYTYDLCVLGKGSDNLTQLPEGVNPDLLKGRINLEAIRAGVQLAKPSYANVVVKADDDEGDEGEALDTTGWKRVDMTDSIDVTLPENHEWEINAVETLIADEMALEEAFEGWRYFDLYRIARHKNLMQAGYGTKWFAWLVSRRGLGLAPYENPSQVGELYNTLLDQENWYLKNPEY